MSKRSREEQDLIDTKQRRESYERGEAERKRKSEEERARTMARDAEVERLKKRYIKRELKQEASSSSSYDRPLYVPAGGMNLAMMTDNNDVGYFANLESRESRCLGKALHKMKVRDEHPIDETVFVLKTDDYREVKISKNLVPTIQDLTNSIRERMKLDDPIELEYVDTDSEGEFTPLTQNNWVDFTMKGTKVRVKKSH